MKKITEGETAFNETILSNDEPVKDNDNIASEDIVICDECGDSLWDRVLRQQKNKLINTKN